MSTEHRTNSRRIMQVCKRLINCYPAAFRRRFEDEMLLTIQDSLFAKPRNDSELQRIKSSSILLADLVLSIIREQFTEWRHSVKFASIIQKIAVAALAAWAVVWAWFITSWTGLLDMADPQKWLLGKGYSVANDIIGAALYMVPFLALLAFVIPALKVQVRTESGDGVLMVRLTKMSKLQTGISLVCLTATLILWGMVGSARMGWW